MKGCTHASRSGQSVIESCIVLAVGCLIFFGLFQVSQLYAAKAVLSYSAVAGARARAVGFNEFMVYKVVRTAAIPNAGRLVTPSVQENAGALAWGVTPPGQAWAHASRSGTPHSRVYEAESSRIPSYLGAERWGELGGVLDYEDWDSIDFGEGAGSAEFVLFRTRQEYPLVYPFARTFYADDRVRLDSGAGFMQDYVVRDRHAPLYLEAP